MNAAVTPVIALVAPGPDVTNPTPIEFLFCHKHWQLLKHPVRDALG